jgi:hypothetical protein
MIENEEITTEEVDVQNGVTPLADVENEVTIQDMNYSFNYKRITNPESENTNCFVLQYKEDQQEQWSICKGLLTTVFSVITTTEVIRQVQASLEGTIENEHHYRSDTSVKSSFMLNGYQIDVEEDSESDTVLFQLITNINCDMIDVLSSANLTFNIINGFSGNHALQLNYGLLKTIKGSGDDTNEININNVFILDEYTKRLIHDQNMSISIEDVTNVQRAIQSKINNFRRAAFTPEVIEQFVDKFPKTICKRFLALFDDLPTAFKNFYYATYILSTLLEGERKISLEIKLRTFISKQVKFIIEGMDEVTAIED